MGNLGQFPAGLIRRLSARVRFLSNPGKTLKCRSKIKPMNYVEIVEAEGHLVDSQILSSIMDRVIECGAVYEVIDFKLGRTNDEFSQLQMRVIAPTREILDKTLEELVELGCYQAQITDATLRPAPGTASPQMISIRRLTIGLTSASAARGLRSPNSGWTPSSSFAKRPGIRRP